MLGGRRLLSRGGISRRSELPDRSFQKWPNGMVVYAVQTPKYTMFTRLARFLRNCAVCRRGQRMFWAMCERLVIRLQFVAKNYRTILACSLPSTRAYAKIITDINQLGLKDLVRPQATQARR